MPDPTPIQAPLTRQLPSWIAAYNEFTQGTEAPNEFHMWTAMSTLAGALNRRCWIDMGTFKIYPSLYIIFVAPPGIATKSTTAGLGMSILEETESIAMAAASGTWQAMLDELQESAKTVQLEQGKPMVTISPMNVFASELGTFLNMSDTGMIDILVDLWDGKDKFKRRTRGSGTMDIPRPYINLLGCTTPSWMGQHAAEYFIGGGFFSRTIFVYAEKKERLIPYPEDTFNRSLQKALVNDLKTISKMVGEFTLTADAKEYGSQWYIETYENTPDHLAGDKFQGYIARRQNHLHKAAMLISASQRSDMIITLEHMEAASAMLLMAENNLATIYDSIITDDKVGAYKRLKKVCQINKYTSKRALFTELVHQMSYDDFEQALKAILFTGECKSVQKGNDLWIRWVG